MDKNKKSFITNEEPITRYDKTPLTAKDTGDYLLEHMDKDSGMGKSDNKHFDEMAELGRKFMEKENRQYRKLTPNEVHLEDAGAAKVAIDVLHKRVLAAEEQMPAILTEVTEKKENAAPETPKGKVQTLNEAEKDLKTVQHDLQEAKETLEVMDKQVAACLAGEKRFGRRFAEDVNETLPTLKTVIDDIDNAISNAQDATKDVKVVIKEEKGPGAKPEKKEENPFVEKAEGGEKAEMKEEKAAAVETPRGLFEKVRGWIGFSKSVEAMAKDASAFPPSKATDPGDYMLPYMDKETGLGKADVKHWQSLSQEGRKLIDQDEGKEWHDDAKAIHQDVLQGKKFQAVLKRTRMGKQLAPKDQYYVIYADGEPVYKATFGNVAGENASRLDIFRKFCSEEYRDSIEIKSNQNGITSVAEEMAGKWLIELPKKEAKAFDQGMNFNVIQNKPGLSSSDAEAKAYRNQMYGDAEFANALEKDNKAPGRVASASIDENQLHSIKVTRAVRLARLASAKGVIPFSAQMIEKCANWYLELDNKGYDQEKFKLQSLPTKNARAITATEIPVADSKAGIVHNTLDALKSTRFDGTASAEEAGTVNLNKSISDPAHITDKEISRRNFDHKMTPTTSSRKRADNIVVTLNPGDCISVESEEHAPEGVEEKHKDLGMATTTETGNPNTYAAYRLALEESGEKPEDQVGESDQKPKDQTSDYNFDAHQNADDSLSSGYASGGYPRHLIDKIRSGEASMEEEAVTRKVAAREEEEETLKVIPQMTKTASQLQDTKSLEELAARIVNSAPSVAMGLRRAGLAEDPGTTYRSQGFRLNR